jgi:hypothetical protein
MKRLAALELLLSGYLHEDWTEDYPSFWHAVDDFVDGERQAAPHFRVDVDTILSQCRSEQEIQQALRRLGMVYYPPGDGWETYRTWLLAVAEYIEKNLHKTPAA